MENRSKFRRKNKKNRRKKYFNYNQEKEMKHIRDVEEAWELLKEWDRIASTLNNDGTIMVKEMARLSIRTRKLIGGDDGNKTS